MAIARVVILELYRRKDFYVLFVLTALITLLMSSVNFFNEDKIAASLKEISLLIIWISAWVIAVVTAARQIPAEREARTIFPLLAKPVTHSQVLLGKFLGCWLACGIALLVFYGFLGAVIAAREHRLPPLIYWQSVWLHWQMLAIIIAMTVLGSLVFAAPSSNATIIFVVTGGILFAGLHLAKIAAHLSEPAGTLAYLLYFTIPQLGFFDTRQLVIGNWEPIPWWACGAATLYAAAYTSFFLVAGCAVFKRKPLN
jgi:ABC-type transport system involved in multi-copper enzyme maturation permease subunit